MRTDDDPHSPAWRSQALSGARLPASCLRSAVALVGASLVVCGCYDHQVEDLSIDPRLPIDPQLMVDHVTELASAKYGGRFPGTAGGALALAQVESVFKTIGLAPAGDNQTYRQELDLETWQETSPAELLVSDRAMPTFNLLGAIRGIDSEHSQEHVLVGAHIDHLGTDPASGAVFPGADDNASGIAVMSELARQLAGSGISLSRSILFVAFNAEEEGMLGSCHYVGHPLVPLEKTVAMLSVDMVGGGDGDGLALYGTTGSNRWLADLATIGADAHGLTGYRILPQAELLVSDHACFAEAGVPAVLATSLGPHAYRHTVEDTAEHISSNDLETSARLLWALLRPLVLAQEDTLLASDTGKRPAVRTHE
ncbi:MAG: M20/M25/M40 family metallo-hydrolase [Pseudomonadota bacterium]